MKIKGILLLLALISIPCFLSAGTMGMNVYGNMTAAIAERGASTNTNASWFIMGDGTATAAFFEWKLWGRNIEGFDVYAKLASTVEFNNSSLTNSPIFLNQGRYFKIKQMEANVTKAIDLSKLSTNHKDARFTFTVYKGQPWRTSDVGQPYLDFFGDLGEGSSLDNEDNSGSSSGIQFQGQNVYGINFRGFLVDYQNDYRDSGDWKNNYGIGGRVSKDVIRLTPFNLTLGATAGGIQYFNRYIVENTPGFNGTNYYKYFFNTLGADLSVNGDIPYVGSYYFFAGWGRSYAPEKYPFENDMLKAWLGNTNASMFDMEFKYNRSLEISSNLNLGHVYLSAYVHGREPHFETFMGGGGDNNFKETVNISYHFPVKALTANFGMEYYHDWVFTNEKYHLFQAWFQQGFGGNMTFKYHVDFNVLFKNGFNFTTAWDREIGNTYIGAYDLNGVDYLTFTLSGESSLGKISPQAKIVALGDTNKQLLSSGVEIFLNFARWFKFYSRFAYVQSAGYWKSGSDVNWWNAFLQFQFYQGNFSSLFLEMGNGGDTDSGFVADKALINGSAFNKRIYIRYQYWM